MPAGGKREGAGRPKGSRDAAKRNQIANVSEFARDYTELAIKTLVQVATASESDAARVSAANAILDRGYGKPFQAVQITGDPQAPVHTVQHIIIDPPKRE